MDLRTALALVLVAALPAHAAQFTDSFDDGIDPDDFSINAPAGFALHALRTSVAVRECDDCVCDTDSSGGELPTSVSDALRILRVSVGQSIELNCPPCS